jgi:GNAT superfamily N-acetyltransferase
LTVHVELIDGWRSRELRRSVLRPDEPKGALLPGDDLSGAVHFGALDPGRDVISTCFIYPAPCPWRPDDQPAWHLRQMATLPERRGTGAGSDVLQAVVDYLSRDGGATLWCNARVRAVPFYERNGFAGEGELFIDERHTVAHLRMWRRVDDVSRTPRAPAAQGS